MNKKTIVLIILAFALGFGGTFLLSEVMIIKNVECKPKKTKDKSGNWVTTKEHICKEKYSF